MRRSHRRIMRLAGSGAPIGRVGQAMFMLLVVALIYDRARDPHTWRFMAGNPEQAVAVDAPPKADAPASKAGDPPPAKRVETVVPGPTDLDAKDMAEAQIQFSAITDKSPLVAVDMPAYWHLMRWSLAQPFAESEKRARKSARFASFFEEPSRQRGQLIRLRLHLRRVLEFEASQNSAGVKTVYEYWGWTDDSKSYPYVCVSNELPPGIKVAGDMHGEAVFVGYFLKTLSYEAYDKTRYAPVMIGRISNVNPPAKRQASNIPAWLDWLWMGLALAGGGMVIVFWLWRPRKSAAMLHAEAGILSTDEPDFGAMFGHDPVPEDERHPHDSPRHNALPLLLDQPHPDSTTRM